MDTAELKLSLFRKIDTLSEERLRELNELIDSQDSDSDFWEELSDLQKKDIKAGIDELDKGKKKSLDEVLAKYKK